MERKQLTVRPRPGRADFKDAFWVYLSSSALVSLKLKTRDLCHILTAEGLLKTAIVWPAREKIQDSVIQTTDTLREVYGLSVGDKVEIRVASGSAPEAANIYVQEEPDDGQSTIHEDSPDKEDDKSHWEWYLDFPFRRAEWLAVGMKFEVERKDRTRHFRIERIESARPEDSFQADASPFKYTAASTINIMIEQQRAMMSGGLLRAPTFVLDTSKIGGLHHQVRDINRLIRNFGPLLATAIRPPFSSPAQGLLLYGPKGTGKTLIVNAIAQCPWKRIVRVEKIGSREALARKIDKAFADAKAVQPSLIVFDQLENLAPNSSNDYQDQSGVSPSIRQGFESVRGANVFVVAETRHPNKIDESLRAHSRFEKEVEIPVPTANDRLEILYAIRGAWPDPPDHLLGMISERTHGYVGSDLVALMNTAVDLAQEREYEAFLEAETENSEDFLFSPNGLPDGTREHPPKEPEAKILQIVEDDLIQAMTHIRPTALQEIFLSTPHTPWSAIGGYDPIKERLQNTVSRPLRSPEAMSSLNLRPGKGLLMYGPPGCSKTLLVKALAAESGLNFLAVKGAEVLSMYVGESERAVREIFRKARAASPSIIFFDEIDSIASSRTSGPGGGSGVNVLTTLLNELDGIEELKNVLVVAATNAPQVLDPALLRPGRLDQLLYVGPPDEYARHQILSTWFAKSHVSNSLRSSEVLQFLSQRLEGHSGAEIVGICEAAGHLALDRFERVERNREVSIMMRAGAGNTLSTASAYSVNIGVDVDRAVGSRWATASSTTIGGTGDDLGPLPSLPPSLPPLLPLRIRPESNPNNTNVGMPRIELDDVEKAIHRARKGISAEMVAGFEEWAKAAGGGIG